TPVAPDVVGVALLFAKRSPDGPLPGVAHREMPPRARPRHGNPATADGTQTSAAPLLTSTRSPDADTLGDGGLSDAAGSFTARLAAFPVLLDRLVGAAPASDLRGAGPMRQDVRRRVYGRVLLAGDAS